DLNAGSVTTTGNQTYNDAVILTKDDTLSGGNVTFNSTVDGAYSLTVNSAGTTTFNGAVGSGTALVRLTTDAPGTTDPNAGSVTTTGNQTYNDAVILTKDDPLSGGNVTFNSTVDGAYSLTVNSAGTTTFNGAVGRPPTLVRFPSTTPFPSDLNAGSVTTTGNQ